MKTAMQAMRALLLLGLWLGGMQAVHAQTDTVTYVYTDPQGTPLVKADAQGMILATYDYTPYGTLALGTAPDGPGYTGHVNDRETGLVYMQARYYQPIGRFLSPDPVGPAAGNVYSFNMYAYASNNPVIRVDPDGRADEPAEETRRELEEVLDPKLGPNLVEASPFVRIGGESDLSFTFRQEYASAEMCAAPGVDVDSAKIEQVAEAKVSYENSLVEPRTNYLRRPYNRVGTRRPVEEDAPRMADGRAIDPNTKRPIDGKPDFGHKRGHEFWREKAKAEQEGLTQKEFNDRMNNPNLYQLEDPSSNRSHAYELKDSEAVYEH